MKTSGTSFERALPHLTSAASDYFGKNMKGVLTRRTDENDRVKVGDIEIIATVED